MPYSDESAETYWNDLISQEIDEAAGKNRLNEWKTMERDPLNITT